MVKIAICFVYVLCTINGCRSVDKKEDLRVILSRSITQSSKIELIADTLLLYDTLFNQANEIDTIRGSRFVFKDGKMIELFNKTTLSSQFNDPKGVTLQNLATYTCKCDSIPDLLMKVIEHGKTIYEFKKSGGKYFFISKDIKGNFFLNFYNEDSRVLAEALISDCSDCYPEMFLYDFNRDGVSEILLFNKYYVHNNYLSDIYIYKVDTNY